MPNSVYVLITSMPKFPATQEAEAGDYLSSGVWSSLSNIANPIPGGRGGRRKKKKVKKKNGLENSLAASYKIEYTLTV
jgi:hypothetical protein